MLSPIAASANTPALGVPAASTVERECTILGTSKADKITGTSKADVICAGAGNDLIYGLGGNDEIRSGTGNDKIFGGAGDDVIRGDAGNDVINGGDGADTISGGSGKDSIDGVAGNDLLQGGDNSDSILGGSGDDAIDGGSGADTIRTGQGNDTCSMDATDKRLDTCSIDTQGPDFGPITMDVRQFNAGDLATFTFNATDASGIAIIVGYLGGPPGWVTEWCGFAFEAKLVSGTNKAGIYQFDCQIPDDAVNETYSLFVKAADQMGNASAGPTVTFTVSGGSTDNKTPEVSDIELPTTAKAGESVTLRVTVSDDSGIAGIYGWFALNGYGFSDGTVIYAMGDGEPITVSESGNSKVIEQRFTFNNGAPAGTYTLWLSKRDSVGNRDFVQTQTTIEITK